MMNFVPPIGYFVNYFDGPVVLLAYLLLRMIVAVFVCWFLAGCLRRIPLEHRKQRPAMVWLLLIPLFPAVWNYFVFLPLARSFQSYFGSGGHEEVGDCGWGISLALYICADAMLVPIFILPAAVAVLVLLVLVLIKARHLQSQIVPHPHSGQAATLRA